MKQVRLALLCAILGSCSSGKNYAQAICALVDVSGTYADQRPEVINVIKRGILPKLMPGDSLYVIRIDSESYRKDNLVAAMTLDVRPSKANAEKLAFSTKMEEFARKPMHSKFTDIRGAMMLGSEYLKESGAGTRTMVIFSDMEEELPKGVRRDLSPDEFKGMRVLAMNVKKLSADNANPTTYRARMAKWQKQVTSHGAKEFQMVLEAEKLDDLLEQGR
jgi:hypothetical protein